MKTAARPLARPMPISRRPATQKRIDRIEAARQLLEARFAERCPASLAWWARARQCFPGGVTHDNRFTGAPGLYVRSARGARKTDADGHAYIDYWVGHGALLLGHGRPEVVEAAASAAADVMHPGACHEREVRWAEQIVKMVPTAEQVRFTASGSEATALAVRLARALTGRPAILKFAGHFHGWLDHAVEAVDLPFDEPWSRGVPEAVRALTVVLPANDLEQVARTLKSRRDIACVLVEPTGGAGGALPLAPGFLAGLRELCSRHGAKLIFDEVITGFRLAPGGAQERFGVAPDLTCLAKVLAGGMPGGAVCGPAAMLAPMAFCGDGAKDRIGRVAQYGTFNAGPVAAAAGLATLRLIEDGAPCRQAEAAAADLRARLNKLFRDMDAPCAVYGFSSSFHIFTRDARFAAEIRDGRCEALAVPPEVLKQKGPLDAPLRRALLLEGVDLPPGRQAWVSAAHGPDTIEETVHAFGRALRTLRELGCFEATEPWATEPRP